MSADIFGLSSSYSELRHARDRPHWDIVLRLWQLIRKDVADLLQAGDGRVPRPVTTVDAGGLRCAQLRAAWY